MSPRALTKQGCPPPSAVWFVLLAMRTSIHGLIRIHGSNYALISQSEVIHMLKLNSVEAADTAEEETETIEEDGE